MVDVVQWRRSLERRHLVIQESGDFQNTEYADLYGYEMNTGKIGLD